MQPRAPRPHSMPLAGPKTLKKLEKAQKQLIDDLNIRNKKLSNFFNNKEACQKLFNEISTQNKDRNGGYTRIIKKGNRFGDFAHTSIIQFVK